MTSEYSFGDRLKSGLRRDLPRRAAVVSIFLLSFIGLEYRAWISARFAALADVGGDWAYSSFRDPLFDLTEEQAALEVAPGFPLGHLAKLLKDSKFYSVDRAFFTAFMSDNSLRSAVKGYRTTKDVRALLRNLRTPEFHNLRARFEQDKAFRNRYAVLTAQQSQRSLANIAALNLDGQAAIGPVSPQKRFDVPRSRGTDDLVLGAIGPADGGNGLLTADKPAPESAQHGKYEFGKADERAADRPSENQAYEYLDAPAGVDNLTSFPTGSVGLKNMAVDATGGSRGGEGR